MINIFLVNFRNFLQNSRLYVTTGIRVYASTEFIAFRQLFGALKKTSVQSSIDKDLVCLTSITIRAQDVSMCNNKQITQHQLVNMSEQLILLSLPQLTTHICCTHNMHAISTYYIWSGWNIYCITGCFQGENFAQFLCIGLNLWIISQWKMLFRAARKHEDSAIHENFHTAL